MESDNNSNHPRTGKELAEMAYAKYSKPLHRYLMRRLENAATAAELAQESFLRLARLEDSTVVRCPQAYLFRIASNLIYELKMREQRDPVTFDSRLVEFAEDHVPDPAVGLVDERLSLERQLESVISQLPPLYASMLVMRKRDGKSMEEIAAELNLSIHTVKKYLCRAIAAARAAKWDR